MQEIYNYEWFAGNTTRAYPLCGTSSLIDVTGKRIPHGIIADLKLAFQIYKDWVPRCFLSGLTITEHLFTAVISNASGQVLGAVSLEQPVVPGRYYGIEPLYGGVGGSISLGEDATRIFGTWRFDSVDQSEILQSCLVPYRQPTVTGLKVTGSAEYLVGDVTLRMGADLVVKKERIMTDTEGSVDAFVIGLDLSNDPETILKRYLGVNDKRPESGTCDRESVLSINGVAPDCGGDIRIGVPPDSKLSLTHNYGADREYNELVLSSEVELEEVCPEDVVAETPIPDDGCKNIDCTPRVYANTYNWNILDLTTEFTPVEGILTYTPVDSKLSAYPHRTLAVAYKDASSTPIYRVEAQFTDIRYGSGGEFGITLEHEELDPREYQVFKVSSNLDYFKHSSTCYMTVQLMGGYAVCMAHNGTYEEWSVGTIKLRKDTLIDIGIYLFSAKCKCYLYVLDDENKFKPGYGG